MLSTVPAGEPPISTWLSGTSWPAFWKTRVYLCPPPPLRRTIARTITAAARAAITAVRAGVRPRRAPGPVSSLKGLAATDRRLLSKFSGPSDPAERLQDRIRGGPRQTLLSRDLTRIQRPLPRPFGNPARSRFAKKKGGP